MTLEDRDVLVHQLLESDDQFRKLHEEHQESERRLEEIAAKSLLSQDDESEEKRIKLHKLSLKDQMEQMLVRYHQEHAVAV